MWPWLCLRFFLWNTWVTVQKRVLRFHRSWVCGITSCSVTWFHDGLESPTIRKCSWVARYACFYMGRGSDWLCSVMILRLGPGSGVSVPFLPLGAVAHVEFGVLLRTVLQRHFSSDPLAQAHIQWSQPTLWEGTCKYKGRSVPANSLLSASLQNILTGKLLVWFELSEQALSSIHWARDLTTGALYCKACGLTSFGCILKEKSVFC